MRNVSLAEKFLSLFSSEDRAAAIVGDLLESRGGRASFGFWWDLAGIAIPQIVADFRSNPRRLSFSAMKGWSLFIVTAAFSTASIEITTKFLPELRPLLNLVSRKWLVGIILFSCSYSAGRWVLRSIPGKEIAVSWALYLFSVLVMSPIYLAITKWNFVVHSATYANWWGVEWHYVLSQLLDQTGYLVAGLVAGWKRVKRQVPTVA